MKRHEFSIVASGLDPRADDFESRFYDAGCDDALVAFQKGRIIVDFTRVAETLEAALSSAMEDILKTGARIERVEPDFLVSLSDMASRCGLTRQALTNYVKGARGRNFPAPVAKITSDHSLWDWSEVALWMFRNEKLNKEAAVDAEIVRYANEAIQRGETRLVKSLKARVRKYSAQLEAA